MTNNLYYLDSDTAHLADAPALDEMEGLFALLSSRIDAERGRMRETVELARIERLGKHVQPVRKSGWLRRRR